MTMQADAGETDTFAGSRERFEAMLAWLGDEEATGLSHAELEARLELDGRELLRQLFQDHLDVRAQHETRLEAVVDADRCHAPASRPGTNGRWRRCSGRFK